MRLTNLALTAGTRHTGCVCGARAEAGNTDAAVGVAEQRLCASCAAAAGTAPLPSPSKVAACGEVNRRAGVRAVRGTPARYSTSDTLGVCIGLKHKAAMPVPLSKPQ